jgi:hypothetical protein
MPMSGESDTGIGIGIGIGVGIGVGVGIGADDADETGSGSSRTINGIRCRYRRHCSRRRSFPNSLARQVRLDRRRRQRSASRRQPSLQYRL